MELKGPEEFTYDKDLNARIGKMENVTSDINDLPVGSSLIPMSSFKQVEKTNIFALSDEYGLKDFAFLSEDETRIYCTSNTAKRLLEKRNKEKTDLI